ncbi:MAG: hypothetical protein GY730_09330 [bacterium]|nr:hypothetical protein [bacterium]
MKSTQWIIIVLLIANLTATLWFGINKPVMMNSDPLEQNAQHLLPKLITSEIINNLYDNLAVLVNSKDYKSLYNMLGPTARAQLNSVEFVKQMNKFFSFVNIVESGAYSHSEFLESKGSTRIYALHYLLRYSEESQIGEKGKLKIIIAVEDEKYQIYGFRFSDASG